MFSRIRSGRTTSPSTSAGHPHEHVVEQDRRVRQDHPLGRRVADVALVPQRLVLERRAGRSRAAAGRGRRSARTGSGCACGASRDEPFWPARNGSMSSPISVCWRLRISVAKRSSEPPVIAIAVEQRRVPVALDDLGADRVDAQARARPRTSASTLGLEVAVRPDRAGDLAGRDLVDGRRPGGAGRGRARTPSRRA